VNPFCRSVRSLVLPVVGRLAGMLLVLCLSSTAAFAARDIADWLMRLEMAPDKTSYLGSFIYEHDGRMETMRVVHRAREDGFRQRLFSLTGSAREIIRDNESVWCFLPDKNIGVHEYQQSSRNTFLQLRGEQISSLSKFYDFKLGDIERIADRPAQVIDVMPKDKYRYGYTLWVDDETGLLLRTDLLDEARRIVERYMFVEISVGIEIDDRDLEPRTAKESLTWFGIDSKNSELPAVDSPMEWDSTSLPPGFMLSHSINRRGPMDDQLVEHHVYSDGLSSVSIFVKHAEGGSTASGLSRMGAISAYVRRIDDFAVTVFGEVPSGTVTMIADGVVRNP
jgi:sigma-E factor negative regulatory protein RseB